MRRQQKVSGAGSDPGIDATCRSRRRERVKAWSALLKQPVAITSTALSDGRVFFFDVLAG